MRERDQALLESVRTHRERLNAAIAHGSLGARRPLGSIPRRLIVGMVIAAIACAACVGVGFVAGLLADRAAATQQSPLPAPSSTLEGTR